MNPNALMKKSGQRLASRSKSVTREEQEVLGLDHHARMNTPGTLEGNWRWRLRTLKRDKPVRQLRLLAESFGRTRDTQRVSSQQRDKK